MKQLSNADIAAKVRKAMKDEASAINYLADFFDGDQIAEVAKTIANCQGRIFTSACGTSGVTAKKIAHTMSCIEVPASFLSPADAVHGGLGRVKKGDIMIFISKGAKTGELIPMLQACKTKGVTVITTTENPEGELARESDFVVPMNINYEADPFNMLATSSTLSAMSIWDAIAITLIEMTEYTREQFKVIHPGGAVGERLLAGKK